MQIGDTLHLVTDDFSHQLFAKATDFVDKKLLPEDAKIKEIAIPGLRASLGDKGQWSLEPPADGEGMSEWVTAWQSARAIEVNRHEGPSVGDKINITLTNGPIIEYLILQREPDLLLLRPDWKLEYLVAGEPGKRLLGLQKPSVESEKEQEEESESPPKSEAEGVMEGESVEDSNSDSE